MSALSPSVIAAIDDLGLAARLVVEGMRAGGHRSPFHGYSAEFQQHRAYRAGDDLKYVDWKLLARTDRLYTRQFRETTSMSVMLVLDASASMAFPAGGLSKFRYATIIAAALAYLVSTQGDAIGLLAMDDDALSYLPARGGRPHLSSLIARLDRMRPHGVWQPARAIGRAAALLKRRGMIVVLSDFYDDEEGVRRELRRVARTGHDVALLQVVAEDERTLPYRGEVELQDLESGVRRLVRASSIAAEYSAAMSAFLARVRDGARRDGIDYALLSTADPPEHALRSFLLPRASTP
jgi:uncharacterized protein (DUF58 family)